MDTPKDAEALFRDSLKQWGDPGTYMLAEHDPLPDAELSWWRLHPSEVEVFGIDSALYPRLVEAFSWYSGAIAATAHNDYFEFTAAEQRRWSRFVREIDGEPLFDREKCLGFMHEAAALPLRQCAAMLAKMQACELRGPIVQFRDEVTNSS